MSTSENPYPAAERNGSRILRRWNVLLTAPGPTEADLRGLGEAIVTILQASRRSAFLEVVGKDIERLAPSVALERVGDRELNVRVEYDPAGFIGDCEVISLWTPIQILDAVWRVETLQGRKRDQWRLLLR